MFEQEMTFEYDLEKAPERGAADQIISRVVSMNFKVGASTYRFFGKVKDCEVLMMRKVTAGQPDKIFWRIKLTVQAAAQAQTFEPPIGRIEVTL